MGTSGDSRRLHWGRSCCADQGSAIRRPSCPCFRCCRCGPLRARAIERERARSGVVRATSALPGRQKQATPATGHCPRGARRTGEERAAAWLAYAYVPCCCWSAQWRPNRAESRKSKAQHGAGRMAPAAPQEGSRAQHWVAQLLCYAVCWQQTGSLRSLRHCICQRASLCGAHESCAGCARRDNGNVAVCSEGISQRAVTRRRPIVASAESGWSGVRVTNESADQEASGDWHSCLCSALQSST